MLTFIIWPFGALISSLPKYRTKFFLNIIWMFFIYYGFVMVSSIEGSDVYKYSKFFESYANQSLQTRINYFSDQKEIDLFRFVSFIFVSFFSKSASVYFAFVGLIFGYYYSRIIGLLIVNLNKTVRLSGSFLMISFLFIMDFYSLQFIRFSTATLIFNFYVLKYFFDSNRVRYLLMSGLSILVHFSFVFAVLILAISILLKLKPQLLFFIYLVSILFDLFNYEFVADLIYRFAPGYILETKEGYLNSDLLYIQSLANEKVHWYIMYRSSILIFAQLILLIFLMFKKENLATINKYKVFLSVVFSFGIMSNFLAEIPSGNRFITVFNHLIWFFLIMLIINKEMNVKIFGIKYLILLPIIFNIIVGLRYAMDSITLDFFFSNFIIASFYQSGIPIIDFIKDFIQ